MGVGVTGAAVKGGQDDLLGVDMMIVLFFIICIIGVVLYMEVFHRGDRY